MPKPQKGPQEHFCATSADVCFYGGSAGGGKSWGMLYSAARFFDVQGYSAIIFRRTSPEIRGGGGLWEKSVDLYPGLGGEPVEHALNWKFEAGSRIAFSHMEHEKDKLKHQGNEYAFIGFDEATHFTEGQFWYLVSRARTVCKGVKPVVRATTNPDPDSWVYGLIRWWIDDKGFAIKERSGVKRWFIRSDDTLIWKDNKEDFTNLRKGQEPLSLTFIPSSLKDNPALTRNDPGYESRLHSLPRFEREQLLDGNWESRPSAGDYFNRSMFEIIGADDVPALTEVCRGWDLAATKPNPKNPNPDWTAGVKMARDASGTFYILDVRRDRLDPGGVEGMVKNTATQDSRSCQVCLWQDPGQAGKREIEHFVKRILVGYTVLSETAKKDKQTYAKPWSAQAKAGNIKLVRGPWVDDYLKELEAFPTPTAKDDQIDATSRAFMKLSLSNIDRLRRLAIP